MRDRFQVLIRPLVTEKTSDLYGRAQQYCFVVAPDASKHDIKRAIEQEFEVGVESVRTIIQPARRVTQGRSVGRRPKWKKAYVTLKGDDSIDIYEGLE